VQRYYSGGELAIANRVIVDDLSTPMRSAGEIRLHCIFGEPVTADMVTLHVSVQDAVTCRFLYVCGTQPICGE